MPKAAAKRIATNRRRTTSSPRASPGRAFRQPARQTRPDGEGTVVLTNIAAAPPQPPAPAPEVQAPPRPAGAHPFAELLRQNRSAAAPHEAPPSASVGSVDDAPEAPDPAQPPAAQPPAAQKARPRSTSAAPTPQGPAASPHDDKAEAAGAEPKSSERAAPADAATADPALVQWFAELHLPRSATAQPGSSARGAVDASSDPASGSVDPLGRGRPGNANDAAHGLDSKHFAADPNAKDSRESLDASTGARQDPIANLTAGEAQGRHAAESGASRTGPAANNAAALGLASFDPSLTAAGAAPTDIVLATPFGASDFAQALGVQVSMLARDGIQRAELHLNPADMGPVSVQIVVDGTQARVDFGADVAATRQAIEAGLAELAGALRDAGLTLHGGGVS
ncbi:MAG TPA: flagellar hook-length control protein FliK, partial [Caldimonas sp.]